MNDELTEETVTDFSEAPVAPEAPVDESDAVAEPAGDATEGETKKGRPRDPNTEARDAAVLAALSEAPATRDALATKLEIAGNLVYLSLWRLRNAKKVIKLNGKTWALPGTVLPEPAAKTVDEPATEEALAES